jgi:hypothetical protein
MGCVSSPK